MGKLNEKNMDLFKIAADIEYLISSASYYEEAIKDLRHYSEKFYKIEPDLFTIYIMGSVRRGNETYYYFLDDYWKILFVYDYKGNSISYKLSSNISCLLAE